jgi:hypothetical protein
MFLIAVRELLSVGFILLMCFQSVAAMQFGKFEFLSKSSGGKDVL